MRPLTTARLAMVAITAILGAWISFLILESPDADWYPAPDWLVALVVVGGTAVSVLTYLSGFAERFVRPNAEFWSTGMFTTGLAINLSFSICACLAWGFALVSFVGGR